MDFTRQLGIIKPTDLEETIHIIGLGGIGSFTVQVLAKMGCTSLVGYEPDIVEEHNVPNQNFRLSDIGVPKGEAIAWIVREFTGVTLAFHPEKFDGSQELSGIVIAAVDSMQSRQVIWDAVKLNPRVRLFIDGRIGGQIVRLFTINPCSPDDIDLYESNLFPDERAQELPCTERAVIYTSYFIAGFIANHVKKFSKGESFDRNIIWDSQTMTFIAS